MFILTYKICCVCMCMCMFLIDGQMAGPIRTKLSTWIHLHLVKVLVKVKVEVIVEGLVFVAANNTWVNGVDMRMEA